MNAFLTFSRHKNDEIHLLGIKNPENVSVLSSLKLRSGQPVICVIEKLKIIAFYLVDNEGGLHQVYGQKDYLFDLSEIDDFCLINLQKYNYIRNLLMSLFDCISISEAIEYCNIFEDLEETIFYNYLHTELNYVSLKNAIKKEIKKSVLKYEIKSRLLSNLEIIKNPQNKILKKKIDVDLSGYSIYINTFVQ
jgi:hypothetical protein